ncbi:uncharacterized protein LOC135132944 [Zophobas morio]|uniref:uncharacterized protein LOC135132944 n=1 Tax=Zophobas morio TaxID=2755281 RepID=UPI003083E892
MKKSIVFVLFISTVLAQNCTLDLSHSESPFIINDDFTLPIYDPTNRNQSLSLGSEELFYVVCPKGTHSPYIVEKGDRLVCKGGTNVLNIRTVKIVDFSDIKCRPDGIANVKKVDKQCATNGTLFEIGFYVYDDFLSMISVCFDEVKLTPIYCKYNYSFLFTQRRFEESVICGEVPCEWADNGNVYLDIDVEEVYNDQAEILQDLGIDDLALMRFPLTISILYQITYSNTRQRMQFIPYFDYMHVVPLWDIAELRDALIHQFVGTSMSSDFVDPPITLGTLGVATLLNNAGNHVEVYLSEGKIPVPKWLWLLWNKTERIVFHYNSPNSEEAKREIAKLCSSYIYKSSNIYTCGFGSVIDPEMRQLIENNFN